MYGILSESGFSKGPYIAIFLFLIYLAFLYWNVKSNVTKGKSYEHTQRNSFILSFGIGLIWGIMMSFSAGFHYKIELKVIIFMIIGYGVIGYLFGIFGRYLSKFIWKCKERKERGQT